jgi:CheY-like chemotaxis protein
MEAVGTLAGGISHDLNNVLQPIMGYSELMLLRHKEGEHDYADLQKIYQAGKRGADLIKSLMFFSRKIETKFVPVDLNQEITQVKYLLSQTIPKTIKIDTRLCKNLESIEGDSSQIGQVLMNLGVNARDAMPDGGKLTFETASVQLDKEYCITCLEEIKPGAYVLLTVSDTGQGMNKETISHIFEPFFTTKERGKGTGLGLSTVYGIVKHHGGYISCYSEPGLGTTFKIYFPSIDKERVSETPTIESPIRGGTETILLVDDEESIREIGARILTQYGYRAITAVNGKEALEIYQMEKDGIALVLLDLIMPVMDGKKCLEEILKVKHNAKVIVASGYSEGGPASEAMAGGSKGFVQKPYDMRQLMTAIREVLDEN